MPKKRLVVTKAQILHLLTVFVIMPVAGYVAAWVARHFPGLPYFNNGQITAFFIMGAGAALTAGIHYLHGLQIWERTVGRIVDVEDLPKPQVGELISAPTPPPVIVHVHGPANIHKESEKGDPHGKVGWGSWSEPEPKKPEEPTPGPPDTPPAPPSPETPQTTSSPATPASQQISGV